MTKITITGRATSDSALRFTPNGKAVASFSVADNHRKKDASGQWVDDGTTFYNVSAWEHLAEQCAEHVRKGQIVTVVGDIRNREWEGKDGSKGRSLEVRADEVALNLAKYPPRDGSAPRQASGGNGWQQQAPQGDPWAKQQPQWQQAEAPF